MNARLTKGPPTARTITPLLRDAAIGILERIFSLGMAGTWVRSPLPATGVDPKRWGKAHGLRNTVQKVEENQGAR